MQSKWGCYIWYDEHGLEMIHPDDLEAFRKEKQTYKVYQCIGTEAEYIILRYGDRQYRVKEDLFQIRPMPAFDFRQKVKLKNKPDAETVILDIFWHFNNNEYYYFITVEGKKKSKRYFESEFIK